MLKRRHFATAGLVILSALIWLLPRATVRAGGWDYDLVWLVPHVEWDPAPQLFSSGGGNDCISGYAYRYGIFGIRKFKTDTI